MATRTQLPRRVAGAADVNQAAARLYQALYGCTLHSAGLLHALTACFDAETEDRFTVAETCELVAEQARQARERLDGSAETWRYDTMIELCERLCATSR
jgi:hypothetical protein